MCSSLSVGITKIYGNKLTRTNSASGRPTAYGPKALMETPPTFCAWAAQQWLKYVLTLSVNSSTVENARLRGKAEGHRHV